MLEEWQADHGLALALIVVRRLSDAKPGEVSREGGAMAEAIIKDDPEYLAWVRQLCERYRRSQIRAAVSVNREMLLFYCRLGKDIAELHAESRWGSGFFETLSRDLRKGIPDAKGLSPRNLRYMKRFYELFPVGLAALPQVAAELPVGGEEHSAPWVPANQSAKLSTIELNDG